MAVILVTGPMASGKNHVSEMMQREGWKAIDADILVHKAIDSQAKKIYETFKSTAEENKINILKNSNTETPVINRRALGKLLFSDPNLLKQQEAIVYPVITDQIKDFAKNNEKTLINATLLYKTPELLNMCSKIIYLKAGFFKRLIRAKKRDKLPLMQILRRFYSQRNLLKEYKKFSLPITILKN